MLMTRNDILRKHKIIPEKPPSPTPVILEAVEKAREQAYENRLEDKDLDELDALEDEEDDEFLQKYRWVWFFERGMVRPLTPQTAFSAWPSCPKSL